MGKNRKGESRVKLYINDAKYVKLIKAVKEIFPNTAGSTLIVQKLLEILGVKVLAETKEGYVH